MFRATGWFHRKCPSFGRTARPSSPVREKSVPGLDEDVATMSIEASRNALRRAKRASGLPTDGIASQLGAVWVGSESHPYAVKPTSTIVAEALGATPYTQAADWQFACKAGTEAMQAGIGFVGRGMAHYALAIGMDAAQGRPGDALEYTAGAGGAAYLLGPAEQAVAVIDGSISFVTDTPDFWRRQYEKYPEHAGRFTGEPAYFKHITSVDQRRCWKRWSSKPSDFAFAVFHQPNSQIPDDRGPAAGLCQGAAQDRHAGQRHRQHLCRLVDDRPDRGARCGAAGRSHSVDLVRQRRGQ